MMLIAQPVTRIIGFEFDDAFGIARRTFFGAQNFQTVPHGLIAPILRRFAVYVAASFAFFARIYDKVDCMYDVCRVPRAHKRFRRNGFCFAGNNRLAAVGIFFA